MTALLMWTALFLQSPECSIAGHVYNASTGAPLKKAQVRLDGRNVNVTLAQVVSTTDADGGFAFDHLPAGQYGLFVDRNGFLSAYATRISCGTSDVTIKMTPQGMIYGKVIDDDGEPMANTTVTLFRRVWIRGERQLQVAQRTGSQADGTFVLGNITSGSYYLSAKGNVRPPRGEAFLENYFPNTPDLQAAAPVSVAPGAEMRGFDLRIRTMRVYSIRGIAFRQGGDPVTGLPLMLMNAATGRTGESMMTSGTSAGAFEFHNVAPGTYSLQAMALGDGNAMNQLTTHVRVTVADSDVEDVRVVLDPGADIPGLVKLDDGSVAQNLSVTLQPVQDPAIGNTAKIKDGAFALRNMSPTLYRVEVQGLLDGFYVKTMKFAGRDLVRRELDLSSGSSGTLEIQVSSKPATLSGTVRNSDGNPVPDATVNIWSKDDPEIRNVRTDASGHVTLRNLAPGDYRAIAWEDIERGIVENPMFRASFENQAAAVTLQEGAQQSVELNLISKASVDAAVAKIP